MAKIFDEFKKFVARGNVIDLAVGVIIGTAFGKIVSSLVGDIIMPPIGYLLGKISFADLFISLSGDKYDSLKTAQDAGAATINYGAFINTVIDFLIVAVVIFLMIKAINKLSKPAKPEAKSTRKCPFCKEEVKEKATKCPHCTADISGR